MTSELLPLEHLARLHVCLLAPDHKSPHLCGACGTPATDATGCPRHRPSRKRKAG